MIKKKLFLYSSFSSFLSKIHNKQTSIISKSQTNMAAVNHLKFLLLLLGCLSLCCSIQCLEDPKAVSAQTNTIVENPTPTKNRNHEKSDIDWLRDHNNFIDDEHHDEDKQKEKNEGRSERNNDEEKKNKEPAEHNNNDGPDGGQREYNHSRTDTTPSSTIVTTIIVVTTETPTIYTGSVNPGLQKGNGDNDPVATYSSQPSPIVDKLLAGSNAYKRLVMALSIVGGIAGIALIAGAFIFTRMRGRKRKRKQALDLESAHSDISATPSSPKSPPPAHCRTSSIKSEDGEMTIIDFNQNPFQDPSNSLPYYKDNSMSQNEFNMSPPQPSSHPESSQYNCRQNQTLSMLSQTTSATLPSAPTAKELDSINYENPFDDQRSDLIVRDEALNLHNTPMSSPSIPSQGTRGFSPDLPPPPAYTLRAVPSAPPLYALPNDRKTLDSQHDEDPSRRHSISNCSMTSIRPLSLRRGSGSHAYISSSFS